MNWIPIEPGCTYLPARRYVLVRVAPGEDGPFGPVPTVVVGWFKPFEDGAPRFVTPGVSGERTHWCDCLGDDFAAPGWRPQDDL